MTDIRKRLNQRRDELLQAYDGDVGWVKDGAAPSSAAFERSNRNIQELRSIESTIATMQLADAQDRLSLAQHEVAAAQREATLAADSRRSRAEEVTFWSRRFLTTLGVAHAAGLVTTISAISRPDAPIADFDDVRWIVIAFATGALIAGTVPLLRILLSVPREDSWLTPTVRVIADWIYPALASMLFIGSSWKLISIVLALYEQRLLPGAGP